MSLTLKLASLAIRTFAKPVGNSIKSRAREHETFRRLFIRFAQSLHRVDMRMRLGILHDSAAQERMHAREAAAEQAAAAAKKRLEAETSTARTKEEQDKYEADQKLQIKEADAAADGAREEAKKAKPKIKPLSETRAIELGANFVSEAFIFAVAAGLLVFERWWSRRKENAKDEHVVERIRALEEQADKVTELEREILRLRGEDVPDRPLTKQQQQHNGQTDGSTSSPTSGGPEQTVKKDKEKQTQIVVAS